MFDPLKKVTICDMVVQNIINKIKSGQLKVGDRLPSERELAESLRVSRVSIREGIKVLASMGLLDVRIGDGTFVKKLDVSRVMEPLTCSLYLERLALSELMESRKIIEVSIAGLAASRATEENLTILRDTIEDMVNNYTNAEEFRESDVDFHVALAEAAQNAVLHKVLITVRDLLKINSKATYHVPGACEKALKYHQGIYKAIEEKDSDKAKITMLQHLEDVEHSLFLVHQAAELNQ